MEMNSQPTINELETVMPLVVRFREDIRNQIIVMFRNEGFTVANSVIRRQHDYDSTWFLTRYYEYLLSKVKNSPRKVHISNVLAQKMFDECKCAEWVPIINVIKQKLETGESIAPYFGKARHPKGTNAFQITRQTNFTAFMHQEALYGIRHLHLSDALERDSTYYKRSENLLLVFLNDADAYFVDVSHHDHIDWYSRNAWQIIDDNWPQVLSARRIGDSLCLADGEKIEIDDTAIKVITIAGISSGIQLKSGVYYVHDGVTANGSSQRAVFTAISVFNSISLLALDVQQKGVMDARCKIATDLKSLDALDANSTIILTRTIPSI